MEINDDDEMRDILYKRKLEAYFNNIEINGLKNKIKEAEEKVMKVEKEANEKAMKVEKEATEKAMKAEKEANEKVLKANEKTKKLEEANKAIILNLSADGFSASKIASICNMSLDEIKNILESKKN